MQVQRGFHRVGSIGAVPCGFVAALSLLAAASWLSEPVSEVVANGPDGSELWFPGSASYQEMEVALFSAHYRAEGRGMPPTRHAAGDAQRRGKASNEVLQDVPRIPAASRLPRAPHEPRRPKSGLYVLSS